MRVAIIHEWLVTFAGAEKVLAELLQMYPQADLFCLVDFLPEKDRAFLEGHKITTSFLQKLPRAKNKYRSYLPLMPLAVEQFDLSSYDLVISSSHCVAKGVLTGPDQVHISYVHSPIRYAWDLQGEYLQQAGLSTGWKGWLAKGILHYMRIWDSRTAAGVDAFIANSAFIGRRIWKCYRREAAVVYPPVDTEKFSVCKVKEDFYLAASRMVPYKKIDVLAEAFQKMPDKRLIIIGDGPEMEKVRAKAGKNVEILGYQPDDVLRDYLQRAKAFLFAAQEDFGILPVEAQAAGTPVIAYGKGGILETVRPLGEECPTGVFFAQQDAAAVCKAIDLFEENQAEFSAENCRKQAEKFTRRVFQREFSKLAEKLSGNINE